MLDRYEFGAIVLGRQRYNSDVIVLSDGTVETWSRPQDHVVHAGDVDRLIATRPELVIIGSGTVGNLRVRPEALKRLQDEGIEVVAYRTNKACQTYREMRQQGRVAAAFHITC
jgi:hypothetical protein